MPVVYEYDALVTQVIARHAVCVPQCVHVFIRAYVYLSECGAWTRGLVRQAIGFSLCWCEFDHLQCVLCVFHIIIIYGSRRMSTSVWGSAPSLIQLPTVSRTPDVVGDMSIYAGGQCLVVDVRGFRPSTIRGRRPLG